MQVLKQLPFVKLLIPFIAGISLAIMFPLLGQYAFIPLCFFVGLFVFLSIKHYGLLANFIAGFSILIVFFLFGCALTYYHNPKNKKHNLEKAGLEGKYLIRVSEIPQIKLKTVKIKAEVIGRIDSNFKIINASEEALFYFDKKIDIPKPGDQLIVKCSFNPIPEPENPYQFNYKRFLKWQGIYYQSFVKNPEFVKDTKFNSASLFQNLSYHGSNFLIKLFKENIHDSTALGVTEALIFGYKEDLPKDLVESYSRTGTLHVLAVSGLHVAIVFLMLAKFLWFLDKWKYGVWLKTGIVIICIWGYCILTGMAPSIIRAGLMITLMLLGRALNRHANIFNTIAVSAFFILCLNPLWLLNVGFQLSFAAVIGIVYLQEYLIPLYTPPNWFLRQVWNILIISLCAQLATFPLSLYYFNQFPNYFLLSNLIIIPLTSIIIYAGIGMVMVCKIPMLLLVFSWLTENLVRFTNCLVVSIEKLPFSFTDGIKINLPQLILLYLTIGAILFWFINADKKGIIYALYSFVLFSAISCFDILKLEKEKGIVLFNIPNQNAVLVTDGRKGILISDNLNTGKQMFYIRGWLINKRLWPIYKEYDFNKIEQYNVKIPERDLLLKNGLLFYQGKIINFSYKNIEAQSYKINYLLPSFIKEKTYYDDSLCDTVYIGLGKSKRLQKKVKKYLSVYHKHVIYDMADLGFYSMISRD